MKRNGLAVALVLLLCATGTVVGQQTLLREDGSLTDAAMTEGGQPVVWHEVSVDERSRVQIEAVSVDFTPVLFVEQNGRRLREQTGRGGSVSGAVFLEAGARLRVGISTDPAPAGASPLRFSLRVEAGPAPELLRAGETRGGDLTDADERLPDGRAVDWYPMRLEVGRRVRLELQSVEFDAFLTVRTPQGGVLENDDLESTDAGLVYTAVAPGTVQVGVTAFGPGERGAYLLNVEELEPPRPLEIGSTVSGSLGTDGTYTDDYLLSGKAGQMVLVKLESEDFDTVLRLRASDGYYGENDDADMGTTNSELFYSFPSEGVVVIQTASFTAEERGDYQLSVLRFETEESFPAYEEGRRLDAGVPFDGMLTASAPTIDGRYYHDFTLAAEAGRLVRVSLDSALFDPYLEVTSPSGRTFEDDDSGGDGDAFVEFEAPASGIYRVRATTFSAGGLGTYTVTYEESDPLETVASFDGTLGPGSPTDEAGRPVAEHEYRATAGETAVIEAQSPDFDTILVVLGPDGTLIAENDDFGAGWNSRVEVEFERSGTYTLVVGAYWDDQSGSYRVTVSR
jgi:hypothetical protein